MTPAAPHTPGPWRWEINLHTKCLHLVGGKPMYDLTIMDFDRWGMGGAVATLRDTAHDGERDYQRTLALCRKALDMLADDGGPIHFADAHVAALRQAVDAFEAEGRGCDEAGDWVTPNVLLTGAVRRPVE